MRGIVLSFATAAAGFTLLFTGAVFHFWLQLALTVFGLCALAYGFRPQVVSDLFRSPRLAVAKIFLIGLVSAAGLYGLFYVGGMLVAGLWAPGASLVANVYALKSNTPSGVIAFLLVAVIGPGEEIFWRGFFQNQLQTRYGYGGLALTVAAYVAVHLPSGNPVLVLAAGVCGGFWGLLFWRFRCLWVNMVSHALWDVAVFVLWPIPIG